MSDRAPASRQPGDDPADDERAEARRFLTTPMARSMIRGLRNEERARKWLGAANALHQEGDIPKVLVEEIAAKVAECSDE